MVIKYLNLIGTEYTIPVIIWEELDTITYEFKEDGYPTIIE
jgi:hypothetical protein